MAIHPVLMQPRLITVAEYARMVQIGVFPKDERLELAEGHIVSLAPVSATLAGLVERLDRLFADETTTRLIVSVHDHIRLARSVLRPSLVLLKLRDDNYFSQPPAASDALLVVEAADGPADYAREFKLPLYGRGGIVEAWLLDGPSGSIEVYRRPGGAGYREKQTFGAGEHLTALALPDRALAVSEILGASA